MRRVIRVVAACIALSSIAAEAAQAPVPTRRAGASGGDYPSRPIRMIVPFAPGASNDILARMGAQHLQQTWGQPVVVDNRAGAEGIIGTDTAVKARPDGYTLVIISSAFTMNPAVMKLPYDPPKALDFVLKIGKSFLILVVGPSMPQVNSVKDLLAAAKAKPGQVVLSSSGGFLHFATALFMSQSKEQFNLVLYKGGYPALMDIMAGQTHAGFQASPAALPHMKSGKLRGIAVGSLARSEMLPELPTLDESGFKGYECANWYAIATAAHTPRPIVTQLHQELVRYFTSPETAKLLAGMGIVLEIKTTEEMRRIIPQEIAKWTKVAIEAGMPRNLQ
ncbi:MAG TPA: tripartite tricarboxylate transporter substrate-binding protein [Burkholderiales bacterium]|nr:tripartite tricarboxylate transporter substrate-binding protein [Burkholderiales bacterium]